MSLAMRQVKDCADFIDTLKKIAKECEDLGLIERARELREQIPIWQGHLAYWEKTLIEEIKAMEVLC